MRDSTLNNDVCSAVLRALGYYSLFQYPIKADEVYGNLSIKSSLGCLLVALEDLEERGIIFKSEGYYSLDSNIKQLVEKRKAANRLAQAKKMQAQKVGRFIFNFPFVRFVGISGSLSKGYADSKSDFDFFIVTAQNRLWICRTFLHLFKKMTFLLGQQNKFCMNYFIDTNNLEIEEKNQYTAIELSSLIPVSGYDIFKKIENVNKWTYDYLPNGYIGFSSDVSSIYDDKIFFKKIIEFFCDNFFSEKINKTLMVLTDKKWRKKWGKKNYPMEEYDIAFKTTLHISKNHPANYQKRVLDVISKFEQGANIFL